MTAPADLEEEWARARAWYDRTFGTLTDPFYAPPDEGVTWLAERLPEGARVVEPACGAGRNTIELAAAGLNVTAFDTSPCAIQRVQEFAAQYECAGNVNACQLNLRDGFPAGPWDAVVISHMLQELTIAEAEAMLAAAIANTAPGGLHSLVAYLTDDPRLGVFEGSFLPRHADEILRHYTGWSLVRFREEQMAVGMSMYEAILMRPAA